MLRTTASLLSTGNARVLGKKRRRRAAPLVAPVIDYLVRTISYSRRTTTVQGLISNLHQYHCPYLESRRLSCTWAHSTFTEKSTTRRMARDRIRAQHIEAIRAFSSDGRSKSPHGQTFEIWPWGSLDRFSSLPAIESVSLLESIGDEEALSLLGRPVGSLAVHECIVLQKAYIKGAELARVEDEQGLWNAFDSDTDISSDGRVGVRGRTVSPRKGAHSDDWPFLVDILHQGWMILDRLAAELQHQNSTLSMHSATNQQEVELKRAFWEAIIKKPLDPWVLQTWRKVQLHCHKNSVHDVDVQALPSPTLVQQKLKVYLESGIFVWTPHLVSFILDVIPHTVRNNQEAAFLAQDVYDSIIQYPSVHSSRNDEALVDEPQNMDSIPQKKEVVDEELSFNVSTQRRNDDKFVTQIPRYPDRVLVSRLLGLWNKSGHISAPQQAMKLLNDLNNLYFLNGMKRHQPDIHVYTGVIFCWAKAPRFIQSTAHLTNFNYDEICETQRDFSRLDRETSSMAGPVSLQLLQEAKAKYDIVPNGIMFEGVVKSLSRSFEQRYLNHAIRLFDDRVNEWVSNIDNPKMNANAVARIKPTTEALSAIVYKLVRTGQTHQATRLMDRMEKLAIETNEKSIAPTDFCFDQVQRNLLRKVQAHGSKHTKYAVLKWDNKNLSGLSWERELVSSWRNIDSDIKKSIEHLLHPKDDRTIVDPSPALRDAFSLFDTMASTMYSNPDTVSRGFLPWPDTVLESAINGWKHMRQLQDKGKIYVQHVEDLNRSFKGKNISFEGKDYWGPECRQPRPSPKWILNRINNYVAVGLFRPSGESLAYILGHLIPEAAGKDSDIPIVANAFLDALIDKYDGIESDPIFPSNESFEIVLRHWRNLAEFGGGDEGGFRARREAVGAMFRMKKTMEDLYVRTGLEKFLMTPSMYTDIVDANYHANSMLMPEDVAMTALELLEQWKVESGTDMDSLDSVKFLQAVMRSVALKPTKEGASILFDCVMEAIKINSVSATERIVLMEDLLTVLAQTGLSELIQRLMLTLNHHKEGLGNSTLCCNCLMESFIVDGEFDQAEKVFSHILRSQHSKPDDTSWLLALRACTYPGTLKQVARAKQLLKLLESNGNKHGNLPDVRCYNSVLKCFLNAEPSESLLKEATNILKRMEDKRTSVSPDSDTYLLYMQLQLRSSKPDKVLSTLQRFCRLCENGSVASQPDVRHFNTVLQAYASSDVEGDKEKFEKARTILRMMLDACYIFSRMVPDQKECPAKPNGETYSTLLDIFISAANGNAEGDVFEVMQAMIGLNFTRHNFKDSLRLVERIRDLYRDNFNVIIGDQTNVRPERYDQINRLLRYLTRMNLIRGNGRKTSSKG